VPTTPSLALAADDKRNGSAARSPAGARRSVLVHLSSLLDALGDFRRQALLLLRERKDIALGTRAAGLVVGRRRRHRGQA
jgi:hypothetical protein